MSIGAKKLRLLDHEATSEAGEAIELDGRCLSKQAAEYLSVRLNT